MGCGQSKIHLYPRKSKSKGDGKKGGHVDEDADADEDEGHIAIDNKKDINEKEREKSEHDSMVDAQFSPDQPNGEIFISLMRAKNLSLLQSQEISSSQQNFFRMFDRKIDDCLCCTQGPDYDSSSETEMALEEVRLNALVQHWESASLSASMCSSASRSLQGTPVRQTQQQLRISHRNQMQQSLNVDLPKQSISPKRDDRLSSLSHHQMYGVVQQQQTPLQSHQQQMSGISSVAMISNNSNVTVTAGGMVGASIPISSNNVNMYGTISSRQRPMPMSSVGVTNNVSTFIPSNANVGTMLPSQHLPVSYYAQTTAQTTAPTVQQSQQSYYGDVMHSVKPQTTQEPLEPRFPPAISVQRLAPQVQRQLRETQELIKDSCTQLYASGYGSPGPPIRTQQRPNRRSPLETQFSQELS